MAVLVPTGMVALILLLSFFSTLTTKDLKKKEEVSDEHTRAHLIKLTIFSILWLARLPPDPFKNAHNLASLGAAKGHCHAR